jgi:hypothetical protein
MSHLSRRSCGNDVSFGCLRATPRRAGTRLLAAALILLGVGVTLPLLHGGGKENEDPDPLPPVEVKIHDEKPVVIVPVLPLDPEPHIKYQFGQPLSFGLLVDGQRIVFSPVGGIFTTFLFDGQMIMPGQGIGKLEENQKPLPPLHGKKRLGVRSVYVHDNIRVTQTVEIVPTKPGGPKPGQKRRLDAVLVRYEVENKDSKPRKIAVRAATDILIVDNDGALFAAPNRPGKVLDGVMLKDKDVPDYVQVLQRPDLKNPMFVAHFTYKLGKRLEPPTRVVLTGLRAFGGGWEIAAVPAGGDSAMAMYWDPREIKPGGKRELAYAYGQGIATDPENEGKVGVELGGSFEPGKTFTVTAYVENPAPGQTLTLELPAGMERVEGKELQLVPPATNEGNSIVLWKGRVTKLGKFVLRVRSSTGVTQTKVITITRPVGKTEAKADK